MNVVPVRVVYDCMVFLQAVTGGSGPAFKCLRIAEEGGVKLLLSPSVVQEIRDVLGRPAIREKFKSLSEARVSRFLRRVESFSESLPEPAKTFALFRDTKDEIYLNLAIVGNARHLVSWNEQHLNYLMKQDTPEGRDFCARFPNLKILTPVEFLEEMRQTFGGEFLG